MAVTPTIIIRYQSQQPKTIIKAKKKKVPNKPLHCSELSKTSYILIIYFLLSLVKPRRAAGQGNSIYFKGSKSIFKKKSGLRAAINIIRFLLNLPY